MDGRPHSPSLGQIINEQPQNPSDALYVYWYGNHYDWLAPQDRIAFPPFSSSPTLNDVDREGQELESRLAANSTASSKQSNTNPHSVLTLEQIIQNIKKWQQEHPGSKGGGRGKNKTKKNKTKKKRRRKNKTKKKKRRKSKTKKNRRRKKKTHRKR